MKYQPDEHDQQGDMDWGGARQQKTDRSRSRAIVSVSFSRPDFERLDQHIEQRGVKMSEFIREAALERVALEQAPAKIGVAFSAADYYAPQPTAGFSEPPSSGTATLIPSRFVLVA